MGFNEMTHAFLAARYYIRLTEQFGDRGREAFIHGIQYYGSQRGPPHGPESHPGRKAPDL